MRNAKRRENINFSYNLLKTDRTEMGRQLEGRWGSFLKIAVTLAVLSASGNILCCNERFTKYVKDCFKTSTWFSRILTGILHVPRLLFWLRLFINFSISDSWMRLIKNEFTTLFLKYVLKGLFPFGILKARFEPTLTKKSLNISAMQFLFVITFPVNINEFGVVFL